VVPERPLLIANPHADGEFTELADQLVREGITKAPELEEALRVRYPRVVVRERSLSAERATWYVYREGSWVPSES